MKKKEGFRTGGINERRDQDWRDSGLEGFMTRGTQDKRDTEKNG